MSQAESEEATGLRRVIWAHLLANPWSNEDLEDLDGLPDPPEGIGPSIEDRLIVREAIMGLAPIMRRLLSPRALAGDVVGALAAELSAKSIQIRSGSRCASRTGRAAGRRPNDRD